LLYDFNAKRWDGERVVAPHLFGSQPSQYYQYRTPPLPQRFLSFFTCTVQHLAFATTVPYSIKVKSIRRRHESYHNLSRRRRNQTSYSKYKRHLLSLPLRALAIGRVGCGSALGFHSRNSSCSTSTGRGHGSYGSSPLPLPPPAASTSRRLSAAPRTRILFRPMLFQRRENRVPRNGPDRRRHGDIDDWRHRS
jgi:hypothetical protein